VKLALTHGETLSAMRVFNFLLPIPTFLEKNGEITNFQGKARTLRAGQNLVIHQKMFHTMLDG